ncbi:MAG: NAD(P)-dependent glycerol-3-phosphate dehydrogenase [Oscillospiraceae bacterium]|nr:NAD(P)-dependent glycerol-3-phosphate dehydrogenase [Oscillospiraceae bacterium]
MKITVLGSGGWGTALAMLLVENGHDVTLWSYSEEESRVLRETGENPMLKGVPLPEALHYATDMACVADCNLVVLATPSFAIRETARKLKAHMAPGTVVVSVSKGIEKNTSLRLDQVIEEEVGEAHPVVALCGPSHAEEVGRGVPTGVVAASTCEEAAKTVQDAFMSPRFRVYASPDPVGVELSAALKNVIALCAGICDGLGYGDNTKAMLMTRGLTETARLGVALGGHKDTFAGLAGVGDLIVTCCSMHSRNRRCGILIGQGVPVEDAIKQINGVVEGYFATANAKALAEKTGVEMPITEAAYAVLYEGKDVNSVVKELMTREKKNEIEDAGWG